MTRDFASAFLDLLYACGVIVAVLYIALAVSALYLGIVGRIENRRRWHRIDREIDAFRAELDQAGIDELRGRAA
jgi:hypothetical protein